MKKKGEKGEKKVPTSLAELDFQILTQSEGVEKAEQIMLTADALLKENASGKISH